MEPRARASYQQFKTLLEFMESHGDITRPQPDVQGRVRVYRLWRKLTNILNSVPGGVQKASDKWKKVWADWKSKTKKKAITIHRHRNETKGIGPRSKLSLTTFEERLLVIMGAVKAKRQYNIEDNSSMAIPMSETSDDDGSKSPSPSPSELITPNTPSPSSSRDQIQQSSSQEQAQSYTNHGQSQQFYNQKQFHHPTITTRPMTNLRMQTSPHSMPNSAHRLITRPRRKVIQIPFDRTTSEFLALEKRRLALEEMRERNNSRRIDVEVERNNVLSRFADIAATLLQHCLGRDNTESTIKIE
ncbi:unnamed protein product [Chrysodeixis includens]|uniref:Regulatory protein zeste n=1 Tax=Chrysodeixis includens TaxID=689277 RepID=A0A9N8KRK7_CHRIL|nr:unnamed protein product [Chrysodeixis includens]